MNAYAREQLADEDAPEAEKDLRREAGRDRYDAMKDRLAAGEDRMAARDRESAGSREDRRGPCTLRPAQRRRATGGSRPTSRLRADQSYGLQGDDAARSRYLSTPTPGPSHEEHDSSPGMAVPMMP